MTREKFIITKEDQAYMDSIGKKPKVLRRSVIKATSPAHAALTKSIGTSHYSGKKYKHQ